MIAAGMGCTQTVENRGNDDLVTPNKIDDEVGEDHG
jgi:hypothetical protein